MASRPTKLVLFSVLLIGVYVYQLRWIVHVFGLPLWKEDPSNIHITFLPPSPDLINDSPFSSCQDKQEIVHILQQAGYHNISTELCKRLPRWEQVTQLYGKEPVIVGLETCRRRVGSTPQPLQPRVAGMYHTGTNHLARLLMQQEQLFTLNNKSRTIIHYRDYDLPPGKHSPIEYYDTSHNNNNDNTILPIILIRDPFRWMRKMCQVRYDAVWDKAHPNRCPNLVRSIDKNGHLTSTYNVTVKLYQNHSALVYPSLADWWSTWNRGYYDSYKNNPSRPRLMIRLEDLLFFAPQVMAAIRQCLAWPDTTIQTRATTTSIHTSVTTTTTHSPVQDRYAYQLQASKDHGESSDLITALIHYGTKKDRFKGFSAIDKDYAVRALDTELMRVFHYTYPAVSY